LIRSIFFPSLNLFPADHQFQPDQLFNTMDANLNTSSPTPAPFLSPDPRSGSPSARHDLKEHSPLHFPTQRPNENVVLLLRRNWTVLARDVIQLITSLIVPPVVLAVLYFYADTTIEPGSALYALIIIVLCLYYLFSFLAYFHDFVDYHLDIWVVTDQRVVSIEQEGLFNRTISELNIVKVQDVTSEVRGTVQTFLDYGQVHIQTAGQEARFVFEQVPHPSEVAKVILQVHDRAMKMQELERVRQSEDYRHELEAQGGQGGFIQQLAPVTAIHPQQQKIPVERIPREVRSTQTDQTPQQTGVTPPWASQPGQSEVPPIYTPPTRQ